MKKIRFRITVYFSILIVLVIIAISLITSRIYSQQVTSQISSVVQQKMSIITRDIEEKLANIRSIAADIRNNEEVQRLFELNSVTPSEKKDKAFLLSGYLSDRYSNGNNSLNNIIAVGLGFEIYDPLYSSYPYRNVIMGNSNFVDFVKGNCFSRFSEPVTFPTDQKEQLTITYYFQYLSNKNFSKIGYMLINVKKESIFTDIKDFCRDVFDETYIINKNNKVIYSIGQMPYVQIAPGHDGTSKELLKLNGKTYLIFNEVLKNNADWRVIGLISREKLMRKIWLINLVIYAIGLLCILFVIIVGFYISKKITDPILDVERAMSRFETGEWPDEVHIHTSDELSHLVKGFNRMVSNIRKLVYEIYTEQEEKKKAEITAMQFKLDSLQSQINPHFMYNTLNSIAYLALKAGAEDIREMIHSFNTLLRASMSVGKDFITIEEEISFVQKYMKIQECRYGSIFSLICSIPDEIRNCKIPKLILQPLVENSLYHGIVPKSSHGTIGICFSHDTGKINVNITDDGVGIRRDEIINIFKKDRIRNKSGFNNIGLVNVDDRLRLYFGDEYRIKIYSNTGIGTSIQFNIPLME